MNHPPGFSSRSWIAALALAALTALAPVLPARAQEGPAAIPAEVKGEVHLRGPVALKGSVSVASGAVLILDPGTVVTAEEGASLQISGRLLVQGTASAPVTLRGGGAGWEGITLYDGASSDLAYARVEGAKTGLALLGARAKLLGCRFSSGQTGVHLVRESGCAIEQSRFENLGTGILVEMKSSVEVRRCSFTKDGAGVAAANGGAPLVENSRFVENKVGVHIQQKVARPVRGNLFVANVVGVRLYQNGPETVVERNLFRDSAEAAVIAHFYSSPVIANNRIEGGRYGIVANQFSSPTVRNNVVTGAEEALRLDRKNVSTVWGNVLSGNGTAIFLDYSSYPAIRDNRFEGNRAHIRLGRFQSSHWEMEAGSREFMKKTAAGLGSRNPRLGEGPENYPESVDATLNWWDAATREEMARKGEGANLDGIFDGYDEPEVTYEGFGEKPFRLDKVVYLPRLDEAPGEAGLSGWSGKENELALP